MFIWRSAATRICCLALAPLGVVVDCLCWSQEVGVRAAGAVFLQGTDALAALAEGQARCAVTGDAFDLLLRQPELSVLETVMCTAVVFSRMQVR